MFAAVRSKERCQIIGSTTDFKNVKARVDTHWKTKFSHRPIVKKASAVTVNAREMARTKATEKTLFKSRKFLNKMDCLVQSNRQDRKLPCRKPNQAKPSDSNRASTTQPRFRPPTFSSQSNGLNDYGVRTFDLLSLQLWSMVIGVQTLKNGGSKEGGGT